MLCLVGVLLSFGRASRPLFEEDHGAATSALQVDVSSSHLKLEKKIASSRTGNNTRGVLDTLIVAYGWLQKQHHDTKLFGKTPSYSERFVTLEVNQYPTMLRGTEVTLKWWEDDDAGFDTIGDEDGDVREAPRGYIELSGPKVWELIPSYIPEYSLRKNPVVIDDGKQLSLLVPPHMYENANTRKLFLTVQESIRELAARRFWRGLWDAVHMTEQEYVETHVKRQELKHALQSLLGRPPLDHNHNDFLRDFYFKYSSKYWQDCKEKEKTNSAIHLHPEICRRKDKEGNMKHEVVRNRHLKASNEYVGTPEWKLLSGKEDGRPSHLVKPAEWLKVIKDCVAESERIRQEAASRQPVVEEIGSTQQTPQSSTDLSERLAEGVK